MPLVDILSKQAGNKVYATSRSSKKSASINWLCGDARDPAFMKSILEEYTFDAIFDFMNYGTAEFGDRAEYILNNTRHYFFISSARVYAENDDIIDENSPRILDTCKDQKYLSHDSYDLAKARQEDILNQSGRKNYTIIRPSLTYNDHRMQFTLFELEEWIYRFFDGNSIVFPEDMEDTITTMTYGWDVATVLSRLLLNPLALGETFNVNGGGCATWGEILKIYVAAINSATGKVVGVRRVPNAADIAKRLNRYDQYRLARGISRRFSNNKVENAIGGMTYVAIKDGLNMCMRSYMNTTTCAAAPPFRTAAYLDRIAHEHTPIRRFSGKKQKIGYILERMGITV